MLRQRLAYTPYLAGFTLILSFGCAKDLPQDPPPDLSTVTVAQFDPTNPIPVLQLVPSPTALAQDPATGLINQAQVAPEPCELPTLAQCLKFVDGWSTTTFPTLFFSRPIDEASVAGGILWLEEGNPAPLSFTVRQGPRDPVNPACQDGNNGSNPPRTYTAEDVPPGVQVVLIPDQPLKAGTRYTLALISNEDGGLRGPDGDVVEPSSLFAILNIPEGAPDPVVQDGGNFVIQDGLLRSQVQGAAINRLFPGKLAEELTADELMQVGAAAAESAQSLFGLQGFFKQVIGGLLQAGVVQNHRDLVFVNTWTTGIVRGEVEFDPLASKLPIPNTQLLTVADMNSATGRRNNFPPDTSSPTRAALIQGLNTLDGFASLAPVMTVTINRRINTDTLDDNIAMYAVGDDGNATGPSIPLSTITSSTATVTTVRIVAQGPLPEGQDFVVVMKRGIEDENGIALAKNSTYNLLGLQSEPFYEGEQVQGALIEQALQCSTVTTTGMLASDAEVLATAQLLEDSLMHQEWVATFNAIANHTDEASRVPFEDVLMAWGYTTQTLRPAVAGAKQAIDAGLWDMAVAGPALVGPLPGTPIVGTASIAATVDVVGRYCVPLCLAGELEPAVTPAQCIQMDGTVNPDVISSQLCTLATNIVAGQLAQASLYFVKGFELRDGNPYVAGFFDPAKFMMPDAANLEMWVIEPTGTPPANGWPAVMFQHGLGQVKESGFFIANTLARNGIATILMDLPFHGSRASDLTMVVNTPLGPQEVPCTDMNGVPNIDPADVTCTPATQDCTGGCDGVRDSSGTGFLSSNLFGARDNFRQGTVDQLTVLSTVRAQAMPGGALEGVIDPTNIGYIGQSLGAITGGSLAAYATADELTGMTLNVGGGDLVTILLNAIPAISAPLFVALEAAGVCEYNVPMDPTSGCQPTPAFLEFLNTARWVLEPADPAALSSGMHTMGIGADNLLMQMSLPDPVVTNEATFILAALYGFVDGQGVPNERLQIWDFSMVPAGSVSSGCHGFILAPGVLDGGNFLFCGDDVVDALCNTIGAQEQAASFSLDQANISPQRPATVSGLPCP